MTPLRAGLIGCGTVAKRHQEAYQENGAVVTAYADPNRDAAERLAAGHGRIFSSAQELLASGTVDVVSICTPPSFHEEPAMAALERGIHVLCEKPLAHTLAASRRMAERAMGSDALLMCAFRHRFITAIQTMRGLLGQIGPLVILQNTFAGPNFELGQRWFGNPEISGGGCLPDTTAHSIDLFRYLVGEITASHASKATHLPELTVEDSAVLVVESEAKVIGVLVSSWVSGCDVAFVEILGQGGRILFDYMAADVVRVLRRGEGDWTRHAVPVSDGFAGQTAHFLNAVRGEAVLSCTAQDGLRAAEVIATA